MDTSTTEDNDTIKKSKFLDFRLTVLFQQYASKLKQPQSADSLLINASRYKNKTSSSSSSTTSDSLALGVFGLIDVLATVGPIIKEEQAKEFIYEYDSTLRGGLVLPDFLGNDMPFISLTRTLYIYICI